MNLKVILALSFLAALPVTAAELAVGNPAPLFTLKDQDKKDFSLEQQKGKWTVLFFFPMADTPGCTKQACAFRDYSKKLKDKKIEVVGISTDSIQSQAAFQKKHKLNFTLLADDEGKATALYGTKMPVVNLSKRWTFILDPQLVIRAIDKDVDPAKDPEKVLAAIEKLQAAKP